MRHSQKLHQTQRCVTIALKVANVKGYIAKTGPKEIMEESNWKNLVLRCQIQFHCEPVIT